MTSKQRLFSNLDLKKLIIPLLIEQLLAITVGMVDTIMISSVGEAAVSGISLVDMINVVIINIFAALATGGAVVSSQFIGAGKKEKACSSAKQLLIITLLISIFMAGLSIIFRTPILKLFFGSIDADVMQNALLYFMISALSYPFLAGYNSCAALFRAMGNSKISMKISILMNIINIVGNALLIFVFHMGVAGAAIASLFSRMVAFIIIYILIKNPKHTIHIGRGFQIDTGMIKRILHIGIPNGVENSLFQIGRVIVVSIIAVFGTTQIAANAVANNLDALGCIPGQAMNLAVITVVGRCVGAGSYEQAIYYIKKLLKMAYILTISVNALILIFMPLLLPIYNLSPETLRLAMILVLIHDGSAMILWPLSFTLPNAMRAANDVKFTMVVSIFSMVTFRILFSYIFGIVLGMGAVGVWIAMIIDWIFRTICFVTRFASGKWKKY